MAQNVDSIVIGASGALWVAPVGTALPADIATALNAAFTDVGYTSEDGATLNDSRTREPIRVWQSFRPVGYTVTEASTTLSLVLRQWDRNTLPLAFGGGAIVATTTGQRYSPPAPEFIDERAAILTWTSDSYLFRWVAPRVMLTEGVETQLVRSSPSDLPITLGVLGAVGVSEWYILTNHPAFVPPAT